MNPSNVLKDYKFYIWKENFAIVKAKRTCPDAFATIIDRNEITLVIEQGKVNEKEVIDIEKDWKILTFDMVLPFGLVGFLAKVSKALADEGISIYVISAYSTDHILIKEKDIGRAEKKLRKLGCKVATHLASKKKDKAVLKTSEEFSEKLLGNPENTGLKGDLSKSQYYRLISEAQRIIHAQIPNENCNTDKVAAVETGLREEIFNGVNYKRAVVYLLSNGCEWALRSAHGCMMCGHLAKQTRTDKPISVDDYLKQFEREFEKIDFKKYPILNLYNNGSFINDNEIPAEARKGMLKKINECPDIKMLVLETRPEFVTEEKVTGIKDLIPDKHVELGVGLEMKNDFYRGICINKGFSLQRFNAAANIITRHLKLRTYVLLKPLFLTEREGIEHAIETIKYSFAMGATTVSLEACTIQDYTFMKYLYERGLYSPPWLWSIIEVVKGVRVPGKLIVGLFKFFPSPSKVPNNCDRCNEKVMEAIVQYNRSLDAKLFNGLTCECKKEWRRILREKPIPFEERLKPLPELLEKLKRSFNLNEGFDEAVRAGVEVAPQPYQINSLRFQ